MEQSISMRSCFHSGNRPQLGGCAATCIPMARQTSWEMVDWFHFCISTGEEVGGRYSSRGSSRRRSAVTDRDTWTKTNDRWARPEYIRGPWLQAVIRRPAKGRRRPWEKADFPPATPPKRALWLCQNCARILRFQSNRVNLERKADSPICWKR
jgi:hypothetical protein